MGFLAVWKPDLAGSVGTKKPIVFRKNQSYIMWAKPDAGRYTYVYS
jgi:hypothetical protein